MWHVKIRLQNSRIFCELERRTIFERKVWIECKNGEGEWWETLRACEARALHTRGSRLWRFENVRKRLFWSLVFYHFNDWHVSSTQRKIKRNCLSNNKVLIFTSDGVGVVRALRPSENRKPELKRSHKLDRTGVGRFRTLFPIPSTTPSLMIQWKLDC